ncbi:Trimeric GatFAB AmidoTransferase(AdT) complex subunit [Oleoguttula sp. CCFEE 5521]
MLGVRCRTDSLRSLSTALVKRHVRFSVLPAGRAALFHRSTAVRRDGVNSSLAGKRIAIKDNIVTADHPTTASSRILEGYTSPFDATVVKQLRAAGAVISSKASLDEFGMGSHAQTAYEGAVRSPFTRDGEALSPGGSSGGSAVTVAGKSAWAALGTDTGGSVRLPAAYCGVVGFKPSYGRLSRWGVIQYANSLDTVGMLANSVADAERVYEQLDRYDASDPTSLPATLRERLTAGNTEQPQSLRIGIPHEYNISELTPPVRDTWISTLSALQKAGHTLIPVSLPTTRQALSAYYVLAPAEASSNLAKYDGIRYGCRTSGSDASPAEGLLLYAKTRGEGFGEEARRRILLGAYALSSEAIDNYFIQAQRVRRLVQRDFDRVFSVQNPLIESAATPDSKAKAGVDVLITPTAPTLPPTIAELKRQTSVESHMLDVFTVPASLAGLPAISVPVPLSRALREGMDEQDVRSVGIQILGQFGTDRLVLHAAKVLEVIYASD